MKINLPKGSKPKNQKSKSKPKSKEIGDTESTVSWEEDGKHLKAKIKGRLVRISLETNDIIFNNNFKINANSIEEAKEKAINFFF